MGLSQKAFAEKVGLSFRTVQIYEKDASPLTISTAQNISHLCGIDFDWLITGKGDMHGSDQNDEPKNCDKKIDPSYSDDAHFFNSDKIRRLNDKLLRLEYISESQLDRVEVEIDRLLEIAEDVVADIKKAEDANWQKDKEQKKEAVMASMGKTQRRKR